MPTYKPNQEVKGPNNGNFKALKKRIEGDTRRQEGPHVHALTKLTWKWLDYPKQYKFCAIPTNAHMIFFTEIEKNNPKIGMETQK